ncbi:DNA polymerase B elongation subunit [Halogeometricum pallidum JCM 14848]|uniref:DNA polymerase B elongation subunit n=2 Tax=Halogeometricum TaxID=60846 RepID=M0CX83_HALPD|nr:DNA polymerase B elongation subunit [Halogeometricum pallidum JCM 14848]
MTTAGPVSVEHLSLNDEVYTLDLSTGITKCKPVTDISRVETDQIVRLQGKRFDFSLAPDHRVPYRTKAVLPTQVTSAVKLSTQRYYKFVNEWQVIQRQKLETADVTEYADDYQICAETDLHGNTFRAALPDSCRPVQRNRDIGYSFDAETFEQYREEIESVAIETGIREGKNQRRQPFRFDGDDFVEFLGWFVTEGNVYWSKQRRTASVQIAQKTEKYRTQIKALLERMGFVVRTRPNGFRFGSYFYGQLLTDLCGKDSHSKRLPDLVWSLSCDQKQLLLDTLIDGDGNEHGVYYTASEELAGDVLRLCIELGHKPRYTIRRGVYQIFIKEVNDGFDSTIHLTTVEANTELYQLTVEDFPIVMAGRHGKFQWVGVSSVS